MKRWCYVYAEVFPLVQLQGRVAMDEGGGNHTDLSSQKAAPSQRSTLAEGRPLKTRTYRRNIQTDSMHN